MQTVIKSVDVQWTGVGQKRWGKAVVKHERDGKELTQNVVSFKNPEVFKKVQELIGQTVEVESVKEGDFWNWKNVSTTASVGTTGSASSPAPATRVTGSNYETKEERAKRQVLIVKQSSLSAAVATLTPGAKAALDPKVVLDLAQRYTDWVFEVDNSIESMSNDIPF
jgi:hypothetical protein